MIKQYFTFALVLLVAAVIFSSIDWDFGLQPSDNTSVADAELKNRAIREKARHTDISPDNNQSNFSSTEIKSATSTPPNTAASNQINNQPVSANPFLPAADEQDLSQLPRATSNDMQMNTALDVNQISQNVQDAAGQASANDNQEMQTESQPEPDPEPAQNEEPLTNQDSEEDALAELHTDIQIKGHVLDHQGKLLTGIPLRLELQHAAAEEAARFGQRKLNTRSNEQGVYAFINLVEGDYRICTVETAGYRQVCQQRRAPHLSADISLTALNNGRISGTVKNEQGQALKGVTVSVSPGQKNKAVTDNKGQYDLPVKVTTGMSYQLYFSHQDDYRKERIMLKGDEILAGKVLDMTLRKLAGVNVTGVVRDQFGNPVNRRTVMLNSRSLKSNHSLYGVSDQNGEFTIQFVEPANDYRLTVNTQDNYAFDHQAYNQIEVYEGMQPLQIQIKKIGSAYFSARVVTPDGTPLVGEMFTLHSGATYGGQSTSDGDGKIEFANAPADPEGSKLRISNRADPKYVFSGITLREGEFKSDTEFVVDKGENTLVVKVIDAATQSAIQGAQGILTWVLKRDGITNQTNRFNGKKSLEETGEITYTELSFGAHQLRVMMPGYQPYSETVDINQLSQQHEAVMSKK